MKFNEFYKTLEEVIGVEELKKFPPENELPCKKIFMLMTLSVKPTSKETDYQQRLEGVLNDLDKKKKESTENVREKTETKDRLDEFIETLRATLKKQSNYKKLPDILNSYKRVIEDNIITIKKSLFKDAPEPSLSDVDKVIQYLKYLNFWRTQKDDRYRKYADNSNDITALAKIIRPYLVEHPYFIEVINNLSDDTKQKIFNKFEDYLPTISLDGSLDFLGQDIANLLRKIIHKAADPDLIKFEELWEKERDIFLEMVFYPILDQLFIQYCKNSVHLLDYPVYGCDDEACYIDEMGCSLGLKIIDKNHLNIERNKNYNLLVKLFIFIAEKENIYSNINVKALLLTNISAECVQVWFGRFNNTQDIIEYCKESFFNKKRQFFKGVKHILEFKDYVERLVPQCFVKINLDPLYEFTVYYFNHKDEIDKSTKQLPDFWKEKSKSKTFKYVKDKLEAEIGSETFKTPYYFQELKNYFLIKNYYPKFEQVIQKNSQPLWNERF